MPAGGVQRQKFEEMTYIGIDPGKRTGFAVWQRDAKYLAEVDTMSITQAMERIRMMAAVLGKDNIRLFIEDARKRTWFGTCLLYTSPSPRDTR
mgnify:CR=1 FL=1